ncbi:UDP-N-acetylmuramoyl-L-alanine--D-glutamate ligase [bacterium]|nr:UDP-N-acetylmuramoyl-L-alanine--D-glutamate ligase [bacterium]
MDIKNKPITVLGLGKSGFAAAKLANKMGATVFVSDSSVSEDIKKNKDILTSIGIEVEIGRHSANVYKNKHLIILSPGISPDIPILRKAKEDNIGVVSEIEFASWFSLAKIIAITGTNGKTTTTILIKNMLKEAGYNTIVAGNIGTALSEKVESLSKSDIIVAEISSFQLETITKFCPFISLVLNITPDHLDRYKNMTNYTRAKSLIFKNQTAKNFTIINYDDPIVRKFENTTKAHVSFFSRKIQTCNAFVKDGKISMRPDAEEKEICRLDELRIKSTHNLENMLATICVASIFKIDPGIMKTTLAKFIGLPHKTEFVNKINNVTFINDSKATNVDATKTAIENTLSPIILIMGGKHKGSSYTYLEQAIRNKVKHLILIGEAKDIIKKDIGGLVPLTYVYSMDDAVEEAFSLAVQNDTILLSPACSSFDMFQNYIERGNLFKNAVNTLKSRIEHA